MRHVLPGLGNEHHDAVDEVAARHLQNFQGVVETHRIAPLRADERAHFLDGLAPDGRTELRLAGRHPEAVALNCVDLSVVPQVPKRLRQLPGGKGVRAVALVKDDNGGLVFGVPEVRIKPRQLRGHHQSLVNHRPIREGRDVEILDALGPSAFLDVFPNQIESSPERVLRHETGPAEKELADFGTGRGRLFAKNGWIYGNLPPAEKLQLIDLGGLLGDLETALKGFLVLGKKEHSNREVRWVMHGVTERLNRFFQEPEGNLSHDARAVAGPVIGRHGAAMGHVLHTREGHFQDLVRLRAAGIGHKADAAGVVLHCGIVEQGAVSLRTPLHRASLPLNIEAGPSSTGRPPWVNSRADRHAFPEGH